MDIHSWNTAACEDWWRSDLSYVNDQQCLLCSQAVEEGRVLILLNPNIARHIISDRAISEHIYVCFIIWKHSLSFHSFHIISQKLGPGPLLVYQEKFIYQ